MSGLRLFIGLPLAVAITIGLFLGMNGLISTQIALDPERDIPDLVFTAKPDNPEGPEYPELGSKVITDPVVPPVIKTNSGERSPGPGPILAYPDPVPTTGEGNGDFEIPSILSPIIRIEPQYPPRCLDGGKEGSAMVEFDITAEGAVINPRVVSSTDRCFNHRYILEAVSRWRYSPPGKIVRGQRTTLKFQLAE